MKTRDRGATLCVRVELILPSSFGPASSNNCTIPFLSLGFLGDTMGSILPDHPFTRFSSFSTVLREAFLGQRVRVASLHRERYSAIERRDGGQRYPRMTYIFSDSSSWILNSTKHNRIDSKNNPFISFLILRNLICFFKGEFRGEFKGDLLLFQGWIRRTNVKLIQSFVWKNWFLSITTIIIIIIIINNLFLK